MDPPFLTRAQSREVDRNAIEELGFPGIVLMENAGRGCVDVIESLGQEGPTLIVCGGGNNGGDGFVIARHLLLRGQACRVVLASDPAKLAGDALTAYTMLQSLAPPTLEVYDLPGDRLEASLREFAAGCTLLVDALLGTGTSGDPRDPYDWVIGWMNAQAAVRLAIDLPSGLNCDTGQPGEPTVRADHTCTFVAPKVGFREPMAAEYLGELRVVSIGCPTEHSPPLPARPPEYESLVAGDLLGTASRLPLQEQIALGLRRRPLVLPMLAATAAVDGVILAYPNRSSDVVMFAFWAVLLPQLALLALWTGSSIQHWALKLGASTAFATLMVTAAWDGNDDLAGIASLLGVYFVAIVATRSAGGVLAWFRAPSIRPLSYSVWHLLVLMTIAAPLAAMLPLFEWQLHGSEVPIFVGFFTVPLLMLLCVQRSPNLPAGVVIALAAVALFEALLGSSDFDELQGCFYTQAAICFAWLWAVRVKPDAQRRLAARRERRRPKLAVVAAPREEPPTEPAVAPFQAPEA